MRALNLSPLIVAAFASAGIFLISSGGESLFPPLSLLSPVPLLYVVLSGYFLEAFVGSIVAACIIGIMMKGMLALSFAFTLAIPALFIGARMADLKALKSSKKRPSKETFLMRDMVLLTLLIMALFATYMMTQGGFKTLLMAYGASLISTLSNAGMQTPQIEMLEKLVPFIPGAGAVSSFFSFVLCGILSLKLVKKFQNKTAFKADITKVRAHRWCSAAFIVTALGSFMGTAESTYFMQNALWVTLIPFFFAGLGIMHMLIRPLPSRQFAFIFLYSFIVLMGWPAFMLIFLGFIDTFSSFREHLSKNLKNRR